MNEIPNTYCIALTGTPVNNVWQELGWIYNIFKNKFLTFDEITAKKDEIIKYCSEHFISYHVLNNAD